MEAEERQTDRRMDSQTNGRTYGLTERNDEAKSLFQYFAKAPKSVASLAVLLNDIHKHSSRNPQRTQRASFTKTRQLNLYRKKMAANCEILVEYT